MKDRKLGSAAVTMQSINRNLGQDVGGIDHKEAFSA